MSDRAASGAAVPAPRGPALAAHQPARRRPHVPLPQDGWAARRAGAGRPRADAAARPRRGEERHPAHLPPALRAGRGEPRPRRLQGRLPEAPRLVPQPAREPGHLRAGRRRAPAGAGAGGDGGRSGRGSGTRPSRSGRATRTTGRGPTARSRWSCSSRSPRDASAALCRSATSAAALLGGQAAALGREPLRRPGAEPVVAAAVEGDRRPRVVVARRARRGRRAARRSPPGARSVPAGSSRRRSRPPRGGYLVSRVSVAKWPAAIAQVVMPKRDHSIASVRIMFSTAARAAPEWTIPGIPLWGERVTLRILPPPAGMKALVAAAWDISQVPVTFSSTTVRKPFGEIASAGERNWPPALLTSTSRRPWRSSRRVEEGVDRRPPRGCRATRARRRPGAPRRAPPSRPAARPAARSRPRSRRGAASSSAVSRPRPLPAPETTNDRAVEQPVPEHLRSLRTRAFSHRRPAYRRDPQAYCGSGMAVHVEPQPLRAPLPGGTAGARVAVEPLIAGHVDFPRAAMVDPGGSFKTLRLARAMSSSKAAESVPVPAFLIRHPSAGPILVDTGLHPSIASGGGENFGGLANRFGRPSLEPGEDVPSQLRAKGIEPRPVADRGDDPPAPRPLLGDLRVPRLDHRRQRRRVAGRRARLETVPERLPPRPLRPRLRLPHGRLRRRGDRLLRDLRAHLRPLRRRLGAARLHPRPLGRATAR